MDTMTTLRRSRRLVLLLIVPGVLAGCGSVMSAGPAAGPPAAAVGRVADIEANHGYIIAEFPNGRMNVSVDKRELYHYRIGDTIRIDSYGRPLPPA
jgi:hypothetical protein